MQTPRGPGANALLRRSPLFALATEGKLAGGWVLKSPDAQGMDEPDKVLVRSNGVLTYTAKDIAYHLWKFGLLGKEFRYQPFEGALWTTAPRGTHSERFGHADRVLNVIDQRQEYPQAMVKLALASLGFTEAAQHLRHVAYGVVSLSPATASQLGIDTSDGKAAYAMSGRQGIGIKVDDLLDQMEAIVARVRPQQEGITSRAIAAAAELHGNTGVYLLYAHARAAGILRKGGGGALATAGLSSDAGAPVAPSAPDFPTVLTAEERRATWSSPTTAR